jgi:hypothetical protein
MWWVRFPLAPQKNCSIFALNMFGRTKYIITEHNEIIVFPELFQHSDFRHFKPKSAGFISFGINKEGNPSCSCYGESISLGLKSDPENDTKIAKRQLNMLDEY